MDFAPAPRAFVRAPGDGYREICGLVSGEEQGRPVEEHADAAVRAEKFEATEDLEPVDAPLAAEAVQGLVEADAHAVSREVAEVLDDQEQEAAVELDVQHDVCLARRVAVLVLRDGFGHVRSFGAWALARKYVSRCQTRARNCDGFVTEV
jgi:hypothetical protein